MHAACATGSRLLAPGAREPQLLLSTRLRVAYRRMMAVIVWKLGRACLVGVLCGLVACDPRPVDDSAATARSPVPTDDVTVHAVPEAAPLAEPAAAQATLSASATDSPSDANPLAALPRPPGAETTTHTETGATDDGAATGSDTVGAPAAEPQAVEPGLRERVTPTVHPEVVARLDVNVADAQTVRDVEQLLAAIGSNTTILVAPGTYTLPSSGLVIPAKTSDLKIIGFGSPTPRFEQPDAGALVVSARDVTNVTFHHLQLRHNGPDKEITGGGVRLVDSQSVRLDAVDVRRASTCLEVTGTQDFVFHGGTISKCTEHIAVFAGSRQPSLSGVNLLDSTLHEAVVIDGSDLTIKNAKVQRNIEGMGGEDTAFFVVRGPESAPPGGAPPATVSVQASSFRNNRFDRFTNASANVSVDAATSIHDGFTNSARNGESGWWCQCNWQAQGAGYKPRTRCFPAPAACTAAAEAVREGTATGALPAGMVRGCRERYAEDLPKQLGEAAKWTLDNASGVQTFDGRCMPDAATVALTTTVSPASGAKDWASLTPVYAAATTASRVWVKFPVTDKAIAARLSVDSPWFKYRRGSKKIPKAIVTRARPYFVTKAGVMQPDPAFSSVELLATMYDGDWWTINFHRGAARGHAIALTGEPHADARLRGVNKPAERGPKNRFVRMFRDNVRDSGDWERETGCTTTRVQHADGHFPGGAVTVAAVHCDLPEREPISALFTVDTTGMVVQVLDLSSLHTLRAVGDLDGDGYDEILASDAGIEDSQDFLLHLTETSLERTTLFAAGH